MLFIKIRLFLSHQLALFFRSIVVQFDSNTAMELIQQGCSVFHSRHSLVTTIYGIVSIAWMNVFKEANQVVGFVADHDHF